jgi:hypothetical protein
VAIPPSVQVVERPMPAAVETGSPRIFIAGALVPLPEAAASIPKLPPADPRVRRFLPLLLGAVLVLLVALAAYLTLH